MISTKTIEHQSLDEQGLRAICGIKSTAWTHSFESQKKWLMANIQPNDVHFMLYDGTNLVGYTNLVHIDVSLDEVLFKVYGIGNVCSAEKGKGYGGLLMQKVTDYLHEKNKMGLLLCKSSLVDFYAKYNWTFTDPSVITAVFTSSTDVNMMSNNINFSFTKLHYTDRIF